MSAKPWYAWYAADYHAKTSHLDFIHDSAYRRLLDAYYDRGGLLHFDRGALFRITSAISEAEQAAVDSVIGEFFTIKNNKLCHERADEEIAKQGRIHEQLSKAGKRGAAIAGRGRPKGSDRPSVRQYSQSQSHKTQSSASTVPSSSAAPGDGQSAPLPAKSNGKTTKAGTWAIELRRLGVSVTSMHPTMLKWIEDGFELPSVIEALQVARQRKPEPEKVPVAYIDPILRTPPKAPTASWWASEQATIAKGREVGLEPRPGEEWDAFRSRIRTVSAN
jgi:uncharacterized protein YdaU (DUF1376 family)